jgi:hypothetical protein
VRIRKKLLPRQPTFESTRPPQETRRLGWAVFIQAA